MSTPIMVRARITQAEWQSLRLKALAQNTAAADIVGDLIRAYIAPLNPKGTDTDGTDDSVL